MFYCAGLQLIKPVRLTRREEATSLMAVNYFGAWEAARLFASRKYSDEGSSMTVVSSIAGEAPETGIVGYSASKSALNTLVRGLAKELVGKRINAVSPGWIDTEMTQAFAHIYDDDFKRELAEKSNLGLVAVSDVVDCMLYLSGERASKISGQVISIDGVCEDSMKLHHHGYVVEDVDAFAQCYPCAEFVARTYDSEQKADLLLAKAGGTFVEFIAPNIEEAFTYNFKT